MHATLAPSLACLVAGGEVHGKAAPLHALVLGNVAAALRWHWHTQHSTAVGARRSILCFDWRVDVVMIGSSAFCV